jgi:coniferyl-aldehyde dehydrogenase
MDQLRAGKVNGQWFCAFLPLVSLNFGIKNMSNFEILNEPNADQILSRLDAMKQAHLMEGPPSIELRRDRIARAIDLLRTNSNALIEAISVDYGNRSRSQSLIADVLAPIEALKFNHEKLQEWTAPQKAIEPFPGVEAWVQYQPLGVVGVVSPWNFPLILAFGPLASVFAAGNRAILKPSEATPRTSALVAELVASRFDPLELTTVLGGPDIGAAFSAQPFDHLVFTGSTQVAYSVMRSAADNLVPVTLELGGKSPVLVDADADLKLVAERVLTVKTFNAGQICLSPDYVLIQEERVAEFVRHASKVFARMYPSVAGNADYTSMLNVRGFERQLALIEDAVSKGATATSLVPTGEDLSDPGIRKIPLTLVTGITDSMRVSQEEIFGPVLPIVTYGSLDDAISYVNTRPRPLALYYFGNTTTTRDYVIARTTSGAVVVNDAMTNIMVEALPFGGVGASGMGHYHGEYGFRALSHAKTVLVQSEGGESNLLMRAPYSSEFEAAIAQMVASA